MTSRSNEREPARLRVVRPPEPDGRGDDPATAGKGATVSEVLKAIDRLERDTIMAAFEAGNTYYHEYEPGRFVGVNTDALPQLECEQQAGDFRLGRILKRRGADVYRDGERGPGVRTGRRRRGTAPGGADGQG